MTDDPLILYAREQAEEMGWDDLSDSEALLAASEEARLEGVALKKITNGSIEDENHINAAEQLSVLLRLKGQELAAWENDDEPEEMAVYYLKVVAFTDTDDLDEFVEGTVMDTILDLADEREMEYVSVQSVRGGSVIVPARTALHLDDYDDYDEEDDDDLSDG